MKELKLASVIAFGVAIAFGVLMQGTASADAEDNWWPAKVQIYNPSCTDGDPACWDIALAAGPKTVEYVPLMKADKKHHICVSFPHLKDSYWVGAAYGIIEEGKRLGQKITLMEAGGYVNLEKQLAQIEDCIANGAEAVVLSAISGDGNAKQVAEIRAQGIPVIDLINGVNNKVDAKSLMSYYSMGFGSCSWVAQQHPAGSGKVKLAWFPGPPGAGWSVGGDAGCNAAVKGSDVEIVQTKWGDTGKSVQLKLVEDVIQSQTVGDDVDLDYIVGVAPAIEAAVAAVRERELGDQIKLVAYYYTPGMHLFIGRGSVAMAPTDQMIIQSRIAIDQAVRALEDKGSATGGRPEYNNPDRMVEHVQPVMFSVTPENIGGFDTSTTLAPKGWTPSFSVD
jgi:protein TorT